MIGLFHWCLIFCLTVFKVVTRIYHQRIIISVHCQLMIRRLQTIDTILLLFTYIFIIITYFYSKSLTMGLQYTSMKYVRQFLFLLVKFWGHPTQNC